MEDLTTWAEFDHCPRCDGPRWRFCPMAALITQIYVYRVQLGNGSGAMGLVPYLYSLYSPYFPYAIFSLSLWKR